jgi:hypothetical protein
MGTQVIAESARLSMYTSGQEGISRKGRVGRDGQRA